MNLTPTLQTAIYTRLAADSTLQDVPIYRAPVERGAPVPHITYRLFSPGVDERSVNGASAIGHPVYEVIVWFRDGLEEDEAEAKTLANAVETSLTQWASTQSGATFNVSKIQDLEESPLPSDPPPLLRGWGAYWRFDASF